MCQTPPRGFSGSAFGVVLVVPSASEEILLLLWGICPQIPLKGFGSTSSWSRTPGKLLLCFSHLYCCWNKGIFQVPSIPDHSTILIQIFFPAHQALLSPFSAFSNEDRSVTTAGSSGYKSGFLLWGRQRGGGNQNNGNGVCACRDKQEFS